MKRFRTPAIGAILAFAFLIVLGSRTSDTPTPPTASTENANAASSETQSNRTQAETAAIKTSISDPEGTAEKIAGEYGTVTKVVDGDTIDVLIGGAIKRVRYIGIDTPETVDPRKPVQCMGKEASSRNSELVLGKEVRLVTDVTDADRYGRLLRYVYQGDAFVNETLVREGFAKVYTYPPDVHFIPLFLEAERDARENGRGLWSLCGESDTVSQPAQASQKQQSASAPEQPASGMTQGACMIKGNINAEGEKIYHLDHCGSYKATKIDEIQGEQWFCSEQDAIDAGWRKALNC